MKAPTMCGGGEYGNSSATAGSDQQARRRLADDSSRQTSRHAPIRQGRMVHVSACHPGATRQVMKHRLRAAFAAWPNSARSISNGTLEPR